jgi:clan AA aspartic protease
MVLDCFRIDDKPILPVKVTDPYNRNSVEIEALIDTGFSGYLLIPPSVYNKINSIELENQRAYATLNGIVKTRVAKAIIKIGKIELLDAFVESPIMGREISLIGRELQKMLRIEFRKGKEVCLEDP